MDRVWPLLGGLVCLAMAVGGLLGTARDRQQFRRAVRCTGRIVEVEVADTGEGPVYTLVVEFRAGPEGQVVTVRPECVPPYIGEGSCGRKVNLWYNPDDPTEVWMEEPQWGLMWTVILLLLAWGLLSRAVH